jgi:integrase
MPYKLDDAWHRRQRGFIGKKLQTGKIFPEAKREYSMWLTQAWELMGRPDPRRVTLEQMETLEATWGLGENTLNSRLSVVREFLRKCGNKDALEWQIRAKAHPKEDRLFLTEDAVADIRAVAHAMGPEHELIYSLGVDNSLRCGDIARMTLDEARRLLAYGQAVIVCKGRRGGKRRLLVLHRDTRGPLRAYLRERDALVRAYGYDPGGMLLCVWQGRLRNMSSRTVGNRDAELSARAGVPFRSHDLRATFGNRHWKAETDILTIAALMGHESPDQTFRAYIGVNQSDMRDAQDRLGRPPSP